LANLPLPEIMYMMISKVSKKNIPKRVIRT
jgi:hypothetical protein